MRILYLTPRPPFPPEGRETVRPYHQIRSLALRHDVDLMCFSGGGVDEWEARERLQNLCHRVQIIPIDTPPQHPERMVNLFARRPLAHRRYFRRDLLKRLEPIGASKRYDLVFVHSAAMAPYLEAFPDTPKIIDLVEVGSLRWREYADYSRFPASAIYRAESSRLLATELKAAAQAQRVLFAGEREAAAFRALVPQNDRIVSLKTPVNPRTPGHGPWSAEPTVLFTGHFDHFPNGDAAMRLLADIFPRIRKLCRNTRLVLAGRNPSPEIQILCERPEITLTTHPGDLQLLFKESWLAVAPHRIKRGVRNEILEAMSASVPVVATEAAVSGLDVLPGRDLVVESDPARFAAEVVRLLEDPGTLDKLGDCGRKAIHNNYSHWSVAIRVEEILNQAAAERLEPVR
jgi:sugar transferase (PEP-CTERM/EpsH1 system associated)